MRVRSSMRRLLVSLGSALATISGLFGFGFCGVGLLGCGEDRTTSPVPTRVEPPRAATGYREIDVALGGSIFGRVTWVGEVPEDVRASTGAPDSCGETRSLALLAVGPRGGVRGSVVVLEGIHEGRAFGPREGARLHFEGCGFEPHVMSVSVGESLAVANGDLTLHNAHAVDAAGATRFDLGLPQRGASSTLTLDRPGILRVVDDAGNPSALAWVHVVEHPYHAVTDETGSFRLTSVPPGQYTLAVWHEGVRSMGTDEQGRPAISAPIVLSRMVTVVGGQDTTADFQLDLNLARAAGE